MVSMRLLLAGASPRKSGDDENVLAAPHHLELAQLHASVADAFAGLDVVLVAMPRAGEVHLVREGLALIGLVRGDDVHDPVDQQALAGRSAGMNAIVAVGVVGPALAENPDLLLAVDHDPPVAVLELGRLGDEAFGHCNLSRQTCALDRLRSPRMTSIFSAPRKPFPCPADACHHAG